MLREVFYRRMPLAPTSGTNQTDDSRNLFFVVPAQALRHSHISDSSLPLGASDASVGAAATRREYRVSIITD
jgi:hypothetical protein